MSSAAASVQGWPSRLRPGWWDILRLTRVWAWTAWRKEPWRRRVSGAAVSPFLLALLMYHQVSGQLIRVRPWAMATGKRGPLQVTRRRQAGAVVVALLVASAPIVILASVPARWFWPQLAVGAFLVAGIAGQLWWLAANARRLGLWTDWRDTWQRFPAESSVEVGTLFSGGKGGAHLLCWEIVHHARAVGWTLIVVPADEDLVLRYEAFGAVPVHEPGPGKPYVRTPEMPLPVDRQPAGWVPWTP